MNRLLSIAIPTFNRSSYLRRLLATLVEETAGYEEHIQIIVSDNASSDATECVLAAFGGQMPNAKIVRNIENIGAEANVNQCFELASGDYLWIIGDDDLPKRGVIGSLVEALQRLRPDLAYLPSEWVSEAGSPDQGNPFDGHRNEGCDRLTFARNVNVFLTFLSGMVVKTSWARALPDDPLPSGNSLPHLAWILPALRDGGRFLLFRDAGVLATAGNTGGYAVVTVFGVNLPQAVARYFGHASPIYRAVIGPTVTSYLPQLIWNVRAGAGGRFEVDVPWRAMRREIGTQLPYWIFVVPAGLAPLPVARLFLLTARAAAKAGRILGRRRLRYMTQAHPG